MEQCHDLARRTIPRFSKCKLARLQGRDCEAYTVRMRRMLTSLAVAVAIALAIPQALLAQRGGGHGFGGGHAGGFSGGGRIGGGFGGSFRGTFSAPAARSFPAPRMNFQPGSSRFGYAARPYAGWPVARSPFGQLSAPAMRQGSYPQGADNRRWGGGYPGRRYPYRPPYGRTIAIYSSPFYPYYSVPWFGAWPYIGNWSDFDDTYTADTGAATDQSYAPAYAPESPEPEEEAEARPAYQPYQTVSAPPSPEPALTIVFKDGHSQQIHNYALTQTSLMLLDEASTGRTPQIPLDEINLAVTEQVNRAAGVSFSLPLKN